MHWAGYYSLFNALVTNHYAEALASASKTGEPGAPSGVVHGRLPGEVASLFGAPLAALASPHPAAPIRSREADRSDDEKKDVPWRGELVRHLRSRADFWKLFTSLKYELIRLELLRDRRAARSSRDKRKPRPVWSRELLSGDVLEREQLRLILEQCPHILGRLRESLTTCCGAFLVVVILQLSYLGFRLTD